MAHVLKCSYPDPEAPTYHVGLDIHSTRVSVCGLNETGQVVHRSQVRGLEEMPATLKGLPDRFEAALRRAIRMASTTHPKGV